MTMAQESSVVFSVQQLLDDEAARQNAESAAREAAVARESARQGRERMIIAGLTTLLVGAVSLWATIIIPGQRRAEREYNQLLEARASDREQAAQRESTLHRQLQQLENELKAQQVPIREPLRPAPHGTPKPPAHNTRVPPTPSVKPCTCLATDPLCDCKPLK